MKDWFDIVNENVKEKMDVAAVSVSVTGGFLADNMNIIVLALTGIYTFVRIYETDTIQNIKEKVRKLFSKDL